MPVIVVAVCVVNGNLGSVWGAAPKFSELKCVNRGMSRRVDTFPLCLGSIHACKHTHTEKLLAHVFIASKVSLIIFVDDMTVRKVRSAVKTGKAVWWVSLISVWLQPSWLPAPLASLASAGWLLCPHLTLLTHMHKQPHFLASSNTSTSRYRYKSFSHSITRGHVHHPRKGNCFLSIAHRLYTSCLSFPSDFSSRAPGSFHRKAICEAFSHSVLVCLSWMGA